MFSTFIAAVLIIAQVFNASPYTYADVSKKIGEYKSHFTTAYTEPFEKYGYSDEITREKTIEDPNIGTQGAGITLYKNKAGETVRLNFQYMGERGQTEKNIYIVGDFYYVTKLTRIYSSYSFYADGTGDFLSAEFAEYIVIDDETFLIDRISERLVPFDEAVISEYERGYMDSAAGL
jgi:hypothetical protein